MADRMDCLMCQELGEKQRAEAVKHTRGHEERKVTYRCLEYGHEFQVTEKLVPEYWRLQEVTDEERTEMRVRARQDRWKRTHPEEVQRAEDQEPAAGTVSAQQGESVDAGAEGETQTRTPRRRRQSAQEEVREAVETPRQTRERLADAKEADATNAEEAEVQTTADPVRAPSETDGLLTNDEPGPVVKDPDEPQSTIERWAV